MSKSKLSAAALFVIAIFAFSTVTFAQGLKDGSGFKGGKSTGAKYIDANGDGVCDNFGTANSGMKAGGQGKGQMGKGKGNGMGQGLKGSGTCTGTGNGTGVCDGTGPKGRMGGRAGK